MPSSVECRLYRRGAVWYFDAWVLGRRVRGSTGERNRRAALQAARQKIRTLIETEEKGEEKPRITIKKAFAMMVAAKEKEGKRQGYTRKLIQHGRDYIVSRLGPNRDIGSVTDAELEQLKSMLMLELGAAGSVNRVLTSVRQLFKFASRMGFCQLPRLPNNVPTNLHEAVEQWQILSPKEIAKVLALVPEEARPAIVFLANIGGRTAMAPAVHRSMCDLADPERPRVHYPASVMKGRKKLSVDLNQAALQALQVGLELHGDRPFPLPDWKLRKLWNKAREAAGYTTLRIHDLRHSRISTLLHNNPPHVVRDMVGHCSLVVTNLYAHSTDEARRRAARSVEVRADLGHVGVDPTGTKCGTDADEGSEAKPMPAPKKPRKRMAPRGVTSSGGHMPRDRIELPTRGFSGQKRRSGRRASFLGFSLVTGCWRLSRLHPSPRQYP